MKIIHKKTLSTLLIILLLIMIGNNVFAAYTPNDLDGTPTVAGEKVKNLGNQVLGVLQAIGIVVSVVVLIILGIKYMLGSIDQKAEYKKSMLPYVIGASGLLAASVIANIIMHLLASLIVKAENKKFASRKLQKNVIYCIIN